jgi:hemerythrin-like domain-containing protein
MLEKIFGKFPDVIHMLRDDHKLVNSLFAQYKKAANQDKATIARSTLRELQVHVDLEEKVIYPAFRKAFKDKEELIDEAVQEHHLVHVLLRELNALKTINPKFNAKFTVLGELVKHHVDEEESEMFPKAEAQQLDWNTLYKEAQRVRKQLASKLIKHRHDEARVRAA